MSSPLDLDQVPLPGRSFRADGNRSFYDTGFPGAPGAHGFTIDAIPRNGREKDTPCATLRIDETGAKSVTGSGTVGDCWARQLCHSVCRSG